MGKICSMHGEIRNVYKSLVVKCEEEKLLGRWEDEPHRNGV
jgi:hypothetical protein